MGLCWVPVGLYWVPVGLYWVPVGLYWVPVGLCWVPGHAGTRNEIADKLAKGGSTQKLIAAEPWTLGRMSTVRRNAGWITAFGKVVWFLQHSETGSKIDFRP